MEKHLAAMVEQIRVTQGGEVPKGGLIMNSKLKELIRRSEARLMARLSASRLVDAMTPRKLHQMHTLIERRLAESETKKQAAPHTSKPRRKTTTARD